MARVSVVIPCYNQGNYVAEAVDSVLAQTYQDLEIIIVNDGSTDPETNAILEGFNREKTRVIVTSNQGLAAARNNGISEATGRYILPLDADDRIGARYIEETTQLLDSDPAVGIVYCRAKLFGAVECEWNLPSYSVQEMLKDNVIFCTALFRREDWEAVGGYDTGMIYGWEDYDFWLSLIERGRKVHQLKDHLFFYRVSPDSMVRTKEKWQKKEMFTRIYHRHQQFIGENIGVWLEHLLDVGEPYFTSRLYVDAGAGFKEDTSIGRKVTVGTQHFSFDLSHFLTPRKFRFDPVDCSGCVRIDRVAFQGEDGGHGINPELLSSNADYRKDKIFMFSNKDPNIIIPIPDNKRIPGRLDITFSLLSVGEQSLREIIDYQKSHGQHTRTVCGRIAGWLRSQRTGQH